MAAWYYVIHKSREKSGPHSEAHIRGLFIAGDISPNTFVWHEGLPNWIKAGDAFTPKPASTEIIPHVALPVGLRGWMGFVGFATLLLFLMPSLLLVTIPMLVVGVAILGARGALGRMATVPADLYPFFAKLKTVFAAWGWMYILLLVVFILAFLISTAATLLELAPHAANVHLPF